MQSLFPQFVILNRLFSRSCISPCFCPCNTQHFVSTINVNIIRITKHKHRSSKYSNLGLRQN